SVRACSNRKSRPPPAIATRQFRNRSRRRLLRAAGSIRAERIGAGRTTDAGNGAERSGPKTKQGCGDEKEESTWRENLRANLQKIQRAKQVVANPELTEIIRAEIDAKGPIPFARFMVLALYHQK